MSLKEKLKKLEEKEKEQVVNWEEKRRIWLSSVAELYQKIEQWFKPLIDENLMQLERTDKQLDDGPLGEYGIPQLEVAMGDKTVIFEPIARNVIGAQGRIDLYVRGYKEEKWFLLRFEESENKSSWELCKSTNKFDRKPLNKSNLETLFEQWITV
jgi:hypothetical protein